MVYMVGYKICYIYVIYFDDCYFVYIESGMFLLEVWLFLCYNLVCCYNKCENIFCKDIIKKEIEIVSWIWGK